MQKKTLTFQKNLEIRTYSSLVEQPEQEKKPQSIEELDEEIVPVIEKNESQSLSHLCGVYFHSMLTVCLILLLICSYY